MMNATVVDIPGITVDVTTIHGEGTPDTSVLLTVRDECGNLVNVLIAYGKIKSVYPEIK